MEALPATHNPVESVSTRAWKNPQPPSRILVIRIEALGDIFATLPILSALKMQYPETEIDLLCRADYSLLPAHFSLFRKIFELKGGRSTSKKVGNALLLIPELRRQKYDLVLDLQRNKVSRMLRKSLQAKAWAEFDRFSPYSVLLRNQWSVESAGFPNLYPDYSFVEGFTQTPGTEDLLKQHGWEDGQNLVILNPAGYSSTRNWPLERYVELMDLWLSTHPNTRFLVLGISVIAEKANTLQNERPEAIINLVGKTELMEMYALILKSKLVISEDSGLGHIAWLSGKKTVMLIGSTRSDWTSPFGAHTVCFNSKHLPCGDCMQHTCPLGTIACMRDLKTATVLDAALTLL